MRSFLRRFPTTYHENGRTRPAEVFQEDRWPRRSRRPWLNKLRVEWQNSTRLERTIRVWWWAICLVVGLFVGFVTIVAAYATAAMWVG